MSATRRTGTFIALLRGINVGGHNKIPMSELRALCAEIGWEKVQSYIQSGNLVFSATKSRTSLEAMLESAIEKNFGLSIPVIIRESEKWSAYLKGNPFPGASAREPSRVALALSKSPPAKHAANSLREYAADGERIVQVGDALWMHFGKGVAKSRLSTALLDRLVGTPVTSRNWRTALKLADLAELSIGKSES